MGDHGRRDAGRRRRSGGAAPDAGLGNLAELIGGDSDRSRRFLGGLVMGALVGAAVAGAAFVRSRRSIDEDAPR